MSDVLIHIGYHKTGTSWLQRHVFPKRARLGFAMPVYKARDVKPTLIFPSELDFDADACRSFLDDLMRRPRRRGKTPVISAERLSGNPSSGGYDSKQIAERLRKVLPEARVLIVIREQRKMVASIYKDYVDRGGTKSARDYLFPAGDRTALPEFDFAHYAYDRLVGTYVRLFGEDTVLVLPYELFVSDPRSFVARIAAFAGLDLDSGSLKELPFATLANPSLSAFGTRLVRPFNALFVDDREEGIPAPFLPPGDRGRRIARHTWRLAREIPRAVDGAVPRSFGERLERRLEALVAEAVAGRYAESNTRTQLRVDFDLAAAGYELG